VQRFFSEQFYGSFIDVCCSTGNSNGFAGRGMVHHIALWMEDWDACAAAFRCIKESKEGIISRVLPNQFSSLYFREGDGLLFELLGKIPVGGQPERMGDAAAKIDSSK
jgi:hypothetical protein